MLLNQGNSAYHAHPPTKEHIAMLEDILVFKTQEWGYYGHLVGKGADNHTAMYSIGSHNNNNNKTSSKIPTVLKLRNPNLKYSQSITSAMTILQSLERYL